MKSARFAMVAADHQRKTPLQKSKRRFVSMAADAITD
jgi:hypothetical protein